MGYDSIDMVIMDIDMGYLVTLAEGRVVKIRLKSKDLTGVAPALGGLTALETLDLHGNKLTSVPAELGNLTALTWLDLSGNQLEGVPPELGGLSALTWQGGAG